MNDRHAMPRHVYAALIATLLVFSFASAIADWSIPDSVQARLDELPPEQEEFVTSGAIIQLIPSTQLEHEFANRDQESLQTLIGDLMIVASELNTTRSATWARRRSISRPSDSMFVQD